MSTSDNVKFLTAIHDITSGANMATDVIADLMIAGPIALTEIPWEKWEAALSDISAILSTQSDIIKMFTEHCLETEDQLDKVMQQLKSRDE